MRAMVLAAGLGTRLKPWTLRHPKALVEVGGIPMLERVLSKLETEGFDRIVVNVHHFGEQVMDYLDRRSNRAEIKVSDERCTLLDTGGGILQADDVLGGDGPMLVHNVDILSNAPLRTLVEVQESTEAMATLLTSNRNSSRRLCFDSKGRLGAWIDLRTGAMRPQGAESVMGMTQEAFSGIYVMSHQAIDKMREQAVKSSFPIMEFFLNNCKEMEFRHYHIPQLRLLDIGKPDSLARAEEFIKEL